MALGALAEIITSANSGSLKALIRESYATVEEVSWLTVDSMVRGSKFPEICPREEVLISVNELVRKREISADLFLILEAGKALHYQLQNSILPRLGVLLGEWQCEGCGTKYGQKDEEALKVDQYAIKCPYQCEQCGSSDFKFNEYSFVNKEYRITGHPDGFLAIQGIEGLGVLEAKSISERGGWEVRNVPRLDHAVQAHIYMWMTDLKWAKVLYWDKAAVGESSLIEHTLERDEDTISEIKKTLMDLWEGIRTKKAPRYRICAGSDAPRAEKCAVGKECFSEEL